MNRSYLFVLLMGVVVILVGVAIAEELRMSGDVSAIDSNKGAFTVKVDDKNVQFESEAGALPKNLGVSDSVIVKYQEVNGKKRAMKIIKVPKGC